MALAGGGAPSEDVWTKAEWLAANKYAGAVVKRLRILHKLNREDVAEFIGFSKDMLNRYEDGNRGMSLETVYRLSRIFDVPVSVFVKKKKGRPRGRPHLRNQISKKEQKVIDARNRRKAKAERRAQRLREKVEARKQKRKEEIIARREAGKTFISYQLVRGQWLPDHEAYALQQKLKREKKSSL